MNIKRAEQFIASADMLDNKQFIQDLLSTPQLIFTNKPTIEDDSALFRVISPEIYAGADSVHIACANFQCTRQYFLWSSLFNAEFRFTRHFEAYETSNLTIARLTIAMIVQSGMRSPPTSIQSAATQSLWTTIITILRGAGSESSTTVMVSMNIAVKHILLFSVQSIMTILLAGS